jgi:NAD(P)H-dependent FMN reductase
MSVKIGIIIASNRPTRSGPKIADWFLSQVKDTKGVEFELIDLAEVNLPFLDEPNLPAMGNYKHEHTKKWGAKIAALDGFVLVTTEYNHGYPAALKNALDFLYHEWSRKPVAFVGYGALGAVAAIEQLVDVTARLGMVPLLSTTTLIIDVWAAFDEEGNFNEANLRGSKPSKLMENLVWWAETLKPARAKSA